MSIFNLLFEKLIPVYLLILIGVVAGRILRVPRDSVATLLIYIIAPVVVLSGVLNTPLTVSRLFLPFFFFVLCSVISWSTFRLARGLFGEKQAGILAFACGSGNTGYFGLPVVMALLGQDYVGLAILCILGFIFFENTTGFYLLARGQYSPQESLQRLKRLPTIYAFAIAILANIFGLTLSASFTDLSMNFRGTYTVLGMLLIGLGISTLNTWKINPKLLVFSFAIKFILWPVVVLGTIYVDNHWLHFFDPASQKIMTVISLVPLPANAVAFAAQFKAHPEETAALVFLSTLFALFYIPFITTLMGFAPL